MTRAAALRIGFPFLLVVLLWAVGGLLLPGFAALGHLRYMLELAAVVGLVAAGQTVAVIGGGIDLSVAAVMTVAAILPPLLALPADGSGLLAILLTLAVAAAIGTLNGVGIGLLEIHPLIMTLATATILQGLLVLIAGGTAVSSTNPALAWLGMANVLGIPAGILVWLALSLAVLAWLHGTRQGAMIFAIGTNPLASRLAGVPVGRVTLAIYAACGFCAGLAGLMALAMNGQGYVGIGDPYLLGSIAAVVLGGTPILGGRGSYVGTIAGAILLITMTALITVVNASAAWRSILFGCLILALLPLSGREVRR
jgi:ribose transport system permease protein